MNQTADSFNIKLASECIEAFSVSTGLGVSVENFENVCLASCGMGCEDCKICRLLKSATSCADTHLYGMLQAQRFGGKYIYFCSAGLNFIISPIVIDSIAVAYVKAGPFLMVECENYINNDLKELLGNDFCDVDEITAMVNAVPTITPERVTKLSTLLFMSVSYISSQKGDMLPVLVKSHEEMQGHISEMIQSLKLDSSSFDSTYPFEKENMLTSAIAGGDKQVANKMLNDLLGHIFFYSDGKFEVIRARVFELLVLLSRCAVEGDADAEYIFELNCRHYARINKINGLDELCLWFVEIIDELIDYVFRLSDVKHVDIIRKAADYIRRNYAKKITLEEVAAYVFLSPSYFSKIFKVEMDCNFNSYINLVRIDKAKQLLMNDSIRLFNISGLVGYENQSYFSKVFKRHTGTTPGKFRIASGIHKD